MPKLCCDKAILLSNLTAADIQGGVTYGQKQADLYKFEVLCQKQNNNNLPQTTNKQIKTTKTQQTSCGSHPYLKP